MSHDISARLREKIRDVADFPSPGIMFRDITPLLGDGPLFRACIEAFAAHYRGAGITKIVSIESRGFIFGAALAHELGLGFVPVRKPGKLPGARRSITYALEYGTDTLEIHADGLSASDRVLVVDDVLATGGTAAAARDLAAGSGAEIVGCAFLIELTYLPGRQKLGQTDCFSLVQY
jgi:adenine phosphoribosyltransferase